MIPLELPPQFVVVVELFLPAHEQLSTAAAAHLSPAVRNRWLQFDHVSPSEKTWFYVDYVVSHDGSMGLIYIYIYLHENSSKINHSCSR